MSGRRLIAIVGPTAAGKSKLAVYLAIELHGEIVNADSRQVYRCMDIGTAKPGIEDMRAVPHHLYDIVNPDEIINLAEYQAKAYETINDIFERGRVPPILVGGSGLYIWAVLEGWKIPRVKPDVELRKRLEARASVEEEGHLYKELERLDLAAARRIDPRNLRRVIRALEICYAQGCQDTSCRKEPPDFMSLIIGLKVERKQLYRRIDRRVEEMVERGLIGEVKSLIERGYSENNAALSTVGYKEIIEHLRGKITFDEATARIKFETHRLVRKQLAWFREKDERITWLDADEGVEKRALNLVKGWLAA